MTLAALIVGAASLIMYLPGVVVIVKQHQTRA